MALFFHPEDRTISTLSPYTGDGATTEFDITFSYGSASTVKATVDGVEAPFTFINSSRIAFDTAPASGAEIRIYRQTDVGTPTVDFADGAIIRAQDLDAAVGQARDRTEELGSLLDDLSDRAIRVPAGEAGSVLPANRANGVLLFDADKEPYTLPLAEVGLVPTTTEIPYVPASANAVSRPLRDKLGERVSILDYDANAGDGTTNASVALATLLSDHVGSPLTVEFPHGTYNFATELTITGWSDLEFIGRGATLKGNAAVRSYLNFDGCSSVRLSGFKFDAGFGVIPTYTDFANGPQQSPIRFVNGSDLKIELSRFSNLYTTYVVFHNSSGLDVSKCEFTSPLQDQDQYLTFIEILSSGGLLNVHHNIFSGAVTTRNDRSPCAVSASGVAGKLTIEDNYATHCGRNNTGSHRLGVFDLYADASNVVVRNNTAENCREQFMRLSTTVDGLIEGNKVTIAPEADVTYSTLTVESGSYTGVTNPVVKRVKIKGNTFLDPAQRHTFAVGIFSYDWGAPATDIEISGNTIQGAATAFIINGPFDGIRLADNTIYDVTAFLDMELTPTVAMTSVLGTEADAVYDNLRVERNGVTLRAGSGFIPVSLSTNRASPFTGKVGDMFFHDNRVSCVSPGTTFAVNAIFNAGGQGRLFADDNHFSGYSVPFLLRSANRARLRGNHAPGFTSIFSTDGTVGDIEAESNRSTDGALSGTATLVAGTVTISTPEIMAGDLVAISRIAPGGTLGHLSLGTITAGASFVVNSDDASDTSTIWWKIVNR